MRVLILGGTGFIGTPLAARLRRLGEDVVTASRSTTADVHLDAHDHVTVTSYLAATEFDAVINLMGTGLATATVDPRTLEAVNADLPAVVLSGLLAKPRPPVFLHAASSTERSFAAGPDESEYSGSKHRGAVALRTLADASPAPVTLLRIHNTYGPQQPESRFVAHTMATLDAGLPVVLNFPDRIRDFVYRDDVVESFVACLHRDAPGLSEEDIGTGIGTSLLDVARRVAAVLGKPESRVRRVDPPLSDPHPIAVASTPGGTLGTCVTSLNVGLERMAGER